VSIIDNLGRKKWRGNKLCNFYQIEESADHLFFGCPGERFVWAVLRDGLGWSDVPRNVRDFRENYVGNRGGKGVGLVWFLFGAI
jgi:hypothetical protein